MPTAKINDKLTISLAVKNRTSASEWYCTHLGFEELFSADEAGWTELKTTIPGVTLGLNETGTESSGACVPVFGVDDIKAARTALEKQSVKFAGDTMTMEGMVSVATFHDLDGNELMIAQDLSESS